MSGFTLNNCPISPGAYMINGIATIPIFGSISNYSTYGINIVSDYYLVLPGFNLILYSAIVNNGQSYVTLDNSRGDKIQRYDITDNFGSSCKLYYKTTEITDVYNSSRS